MRWRVVLFRLLFFSLVGRMKNKNQITIQCFELVAQICLNVHYRQRIVVINNKNKINMKINMEQMKLTITTKLHNIQDYCLSSFQFQCGIVHHSQVCPPLHR